MLDTLKRRLVFAIWIVAAFVSQARAQDSGAASTPPAIDIERFLPVRSDAMTVGPFEARQRRTGVSRPFFLVGCDPYSIAWIERNRARLQALGALGLVVEAADAQAYRRLEAAAGRLIVRPVSGNLLAEHLRIDRYPALITAEGVFP